jgi:hypothetical protein
MPAARQPQVQMAAGRDARIVLRRDSDGEGLEASG